MRTPKLLLALLLASCLSAFCAAGVFAEEEDGGEDDEPHTYYYAEDDVEITVKGEIQLEDDSFLSMDVPEHLVDSVLESLETIENYADSETYIVDQDHREAPPSDGSHIHSYKVSKIVAVKHYVFEDAPYCLRCDYLLYRCKECEFEYNEFVSSKRVSCHSDPASRDWEIYDNYLYYNNGDLHKTEGFTVDSIGLYLKPLLIEVAGEAVDSSIFPGIKNSILGMDFSESDRYVTIRFKSAGTPYSEDQLAEYISCLKYLDALTYTSSVAPAYGVIGSQTVPEDPPANEPHGAVSETVSQSPESEYGIPESTSAHSGEDAAPHTENGAPAGQYAQHNPQTGDSIALYVCLAASSFAALAVLLIIRRKEKNVNKL